VTGILQANERVTPDPGRWSDDYNIFQLAACKSPKGLRCTTLTDLYYPHGAAVLDPLFAGSYLRVADRRTGTGTGTAFFGIRAATPYGRKIWAADRMTSVTIVGRIAKATGPRTVKCGAPPLTEAP
jgi:hypothetical protein